MDALNSVFLGIIALAALAQTVFLIALSLGIRKLVLKVSELSELIEKEVRPALDELLHVVHNVAEISEMSVAQARRINGALTDALDKVKRGGEAVNSIMGRPVGLFGNARAFVRGILRGVEVYGMLRKRPTGRANDPDDDASASAQNEGKR